MRTLSLVAGAVLALGLVAATPATARGGDARIWVSMGDVMFSAGRPYHRHHHHPLQILHGPRGPSYYYYPVPAYGYYPMPPRPYAYPAYYPPAPYHRPAPPPPRPGYPRHRPGYYR